MRCLLAGLSVCGCASVDTNPMLGPSGYSAPSFADV